MGSEFYIALGLNSTSHELGSIQLHPTLATMKAIEIRDLKRSFKNVA